VYAQIERIADVDKIPMDVLLATMVQDYVAYKDLRRIAAAGARVDETDESQYKGE
jgi:hypothetical protein